MLQYEWGDFALDAQGLIEEIRPLVARGEIKSVYGIPRGGYSLASRLAYGLDLPIVERADISETTLVVDDIARTGKTFEELQGKNKYTAALFWCSGTSSVEPSFWAKKISDFIRFPWALEDKPGRTEK